MFSPSEDDDSLDVSDVIVDCEEGMKSQNNSMCSKELILSTSKYCNLCLWIQGVSRRNGYPGSATENLVLSQDKNCRLLSCVNNKAMEFGCWDLNFVVEIGKQERLNFQENRNKTLLNYVIIWVSMIQVGNYLVVRYMYVGLN